MASNSQRRANRANALKSTGPITEIGKEMSRMNALTHGATASVTVLPHESAQLLAELHRDLVHEYDPQTRTEMELVEKLAHTFWRGRRIPRFEQALYAWLSVRNNVVFHDGPPGAGLSYPELDKFRKEKTREEFQELYLGRVLMEALQRDLPAKMARYEIHISREIDKTIERLTKLRAERGEDRRLALPSAALSVPDSTDMLLILPATAYWRSFRAWQKQWRPL